MTSAVELVPYSAEWPVRFAEEAALLVAALSTWLVAAPEHIGSTAVPGLAAKPVIDIIAPVLTLAASRPAIAAAQRLGYCYAPYKAHEMHWLCKPSPDLRTHHLHLVEHGSDVWRERLAFRDALRENPKLMQEYEMLKRELAVLHAFDRDAYTEGKSMFVRRAIDARLRRGRAV